MRFYILFIIVSAIAISVNADTIEKPKLSPGFEDCSKSLLGITNRLVSVNTAYSKFKDFNSIRVVITFNIPENPMKKVSSSAEEMCCQNFAPSMNDEDFNEIFALLPPLVDNYDSIATYLVSQEPNVVKSSKTLKAVNGTLPVISNNLNTLFNCLTSKTPANRTPDKTDLLDKFNKVFSAAKAAYEF